MRDRQCHTARAALDRITLQYALRTSLLPLTSKRDVQPCTPVGNVEQNQGADELVVPLLGPAAQELDLLPFVGRLDTEPTAIPGHPHPPSKHHPAAASN